MYIAPIIRTRDGSHLLAGRQILGRVLGPNPGRGYSNTRVPKFSGTWKFGVSVLMGLHDR